MHPALFAPALLRACLLLLVCLTPILATAAAPMVMLVVSRDESWFHEAYPEHADLDGDGVPDSTYRDIVAYPGYFHPGLCYRYDDVDDRFEPAGGNDGTGNGHYCSGAAADAFSGNFLNWATMTRMDLVRRALYGGRRVLDTAALTVLERAQLPGDGHSFAKT
jgi:type IV pilus assembly protein PilY1